MKSLDIKISKSRVLDEVAKTTAYIGAKATGEDPAAYERVAAVDADREQLERYWMEACSDITSVLGGWMSYAGTVGLTHHVELSRDYEMTLRLTDNWNSALGGAINDALTSYMVNVIVAKWCMITAKQDAEGYATLAANSIEQARRNTLSRSRPRKRTSSVQPTAGSCFGSGAWKGDRPWVGTDEWKGEEDGVQAEGL